MERAQRARADGVPHSRVLARVLSERTIAAMVEALLFLATGLLLEEWRRKPEAD